MRRSGISLPGSILICVIALSCSVTWAQQTYHNRSCRVLDLDSCGRMLTLSNPTFFRSGDTIVVHQTSSADTALIGAAEFNIIDTMIGAMAYLRYPFEGIFEAAGQLQVVAAICTNVCDNDDRVSVVPWNGQFGGLIVLVSTDTLYLNRIIDASGAGFRGGRPGWNSSDTADKQVQSITEGALPTRNGRARNGGGYGGSLVTPGGRGGSTTTAFAIDDHSPDHVRLLPSRDTARMRVYLGSAGGAGHQNDLRGGRGGTGGGVIIIRAPAVRIGPLAALDVSGGDGSDATSDGAGGGGSGGTVVIVADTVLGTLRCDISGGIGGSTGGSLYRYGPGGGGSGGLLQLSTQSTLSAIRLQRGGGAGGGSKIDTSSVSLPHGATPGSDGVVHLLRTRLFQSGVPDRACVLVLADTVINGEQFMKITPTRGNVRTWYTDGDPVPGEAQLLLPLNNVIRRIEADVEVWGCIARVAIDLPVRPQTGDDLRVVVDQLRANVGDTVSVFVRIERGSTSSAIRGSVTLRFYQPVLMPIEERFRKAARYTSVEVPFTLARESRSTFRRVEAVALLGDSVSVQISIDSVAVSPSATRVERTHGRLTLNDICADPRLRLFDPSSSIRVRGRMVSLLAEEGIVTNIRGQVLTRLRSTAQDGWLHGELPDDHRGPSFLVAMRGTETFTYAFIIGD